MASDNTIGSEELSNQGLCRVSRGGSREGSGLTNRQHQQPPEDAAACSFAVERVADPHSSLPARWILGLRRPQHVLAQPAETLQSGCAPQKRTERTRFPLRNLAPGERS